ncbi:MAG: succinylglutamate desuccinylase/aspartoacylase family protein [Gammaproteobacteria bacterium]|nr:succinylglutamate desuccinylase/aspartoacylase family protein [Gammaproteobacteria bacterium]
MKQQKIKVGDTYVHPGETASLALPMPEVYSCTPMYMPVKIAHGKNSGPCLVVFSTIYGNELNGIEIINRLMSESCLENLSGTIIAVPVINVFGMVHYPKKLPTGNSLEFCFPGDPNGAYGDRVAYLLTEEIFKKANYCIDIKVGADHNDKLPQVYCSYSDQETKSLARCFQAPVITEVEVQQKSIRSLLESMSVPFIVYEAGEALRFNESAINTGVHGILNVMHCLKMIEKHDNNVSVAPVFSQQQAWFVSPRSGIFKATVGLGERIKKGQEMGKIADPFSPDFDQTVYADNDAIVVGINTHPLVYEGQPIVKLASFIDNNRAETAIGQWEEAQEELSSDDANNKTHK